MAKANKKRDLGLRIDDDLLNKLKKMAEHESRSISGEITYLISRRVEQFEKKHGPLLGEDDKE